jgi:tRNA (cmo5U34)-methyltransferase
MTDDSISVFDAHAAAYDDLRRRLVPCFDAFYGAAVALVADTAPADILDLGAGTGLLSALLADACPEARLHLLDGSAPMLEQARARLGERPVAMHLADLADPLPDGPYDAIVSALAIHHLPDPVKRTLTHRAFAALRPGGIFVNAEQVAGPTPALDARYCAAHEAAARALGASDEEWAGAEHRMAHDRCTPVEDQLAWLREAGFTDVDCPMRDGRFAVLTGRRPAQA